MAKFGELVTLGRKRKGLSQAELADAVNDNIKGCSYNQGTVSRWERNFGLPEKEPIVTKIADLLEIKREELVLAWKEGAGATAERLGNTPVEYFVELQDELSLYEEERKPCECWFVGPNHLPAFTENLVSRKWKENMERGHNYHFLWILDYLPDRGRSLEDMKEKLGEMNRTWGADLTEGKTKDGLDKGKLYLYMLTLHSDDKSEPESIKRSRQEFKALASAVGGRDWIVVPGDIVLDDPGVKAKLQGFTQKWATIICYFSSESDLTPFASASTDCLRRRRNDKVELNFFWFDKDTARDLRDVILEIKKKIPTSTDTPSKSKLKHRSEPA